MTAFSLGRRFDVVTCLFSSIGYVGTVERLGDAIAAMAAHLDPGGVLIVEPWLTPDAWVADRPHLLSVDEPDLKIARMTISGREGRLAIMNFEYLDRHPGRDRGVLGAPRGGAVHGRGVPAGIRRRRALRRARPGGPDRPRALHRAACAMSSAARPARGGPGASMSTRPRAPSGSSTTGTASRSARSGAGPASAACESRTIRLPSPRSPARSSGSSGTSSAPSGTSARRRSRRRCPNVCARSAGAIPSRPGIRSSPRWCSRRSRRRPTASRSGASRRSTTISRASRSCSPPMRSRRRRAARERAEARQTFERRTRRGGLQWLAVVDDAPVAFALADRSPVGLFLAGGATLPEARGRGCYRALVRARWDEAMALGLPGLAVQAQYKSSAPILRRLGFVETATVHTLRSPARPVLRPGTRRSPGGAGAPSRSCCRAWARRGGRSRGAQDHRGRSSSPTSLW